jgi:hypothetical protein
MASFGVEDDRDVVRAELKDLGREADALRVARAEAAIDLDPISIGAGLWGRRR